MTLDLVSFSARLDDVVATSKASGWRDRFEVAMTDGYGEVLQLEEERRRARLRLQTVLGRIARDPRAVHEASRITEEIGELTARIRAVRDLLERAARSLGAA